MAVVKYITKAALIVGVWLAATPAMAQNYSPYRGADESRAYWDGRMDAEYDHFVRDWIERNYQQQMNDIDRQSIDLHQRCNVMVCDPK